MLQVSFTARVTAFDYVTRNRRKMFIKEATKILNMLRSDFTPINSKRRLTGGVRNGANM